MVSASAETLVKFSKPLDGEISVRCSPANEGYSSDRAPER